LEIKGGETEKKLWCGKRREESQLALEKHELLTPALHFLVITYLFFAFIWGVLPSFLLTVCLTYCSSCSISKNGQGRAVKGGPKDALGLYISFF
jgi:hypothetical protein